MCWKTRLRRAPALAAALIGLGLVGESVPAQGFGGAEGVVTARILPGWETGATTRMGALHLSLAPGWKTYWRSPGDAGIPPQFNWSDSQNLAGVTVHWPRPEVHDINGMRSIGYSGEVVLPLEFTAQRAGAPVQLSAEISMGICEDVCIPVSLRVEAQLTGAGASDALIKGALATLPRAAQITVTCTIRPIRDGMEVSASIPLPRLAGVETVVIEPRDSSIWVSEPHSERTGGRLEARAELVPPQAKPFPVDRSGLRFTVIGASDAVEIRGCTGG